MDNVTIFLVVDAEGNATASTDLDAAWECHNEQYGSDTQGGVRILKLRVFVPLPQIVELTGTAPAGGQAELVVKE